MAKDAKQGPARSNGQFSTPAAKTSFSAPAPSVGEGPVFSAKVSVTKPAATKGMAKAALQERNPPQLMKAKSPETSSRIMRVVERANRLKDMARAQHQKLKEPFIAKEAIKRWKHYHNRTVSMPMPSDAKITTRPNEILNIARRAVESRAVQRLKRINDIQTSMCNALLKNEPKQKQKVSLDLTAENHPRRQFKKAARHQLKMKV